MQVDELHNKFLKEANRLYPNLALQEVAKNILYSQLTDADILKIYNRAFPVFNVELLAKYRFVYNKALEVLSKMQSSNTVIEFESKIKQHKQTNTEDFDKVIGGLLKVKPPKN